MGRHIIIIILFALTAFAGAVPGDFILDDYIVIVNNRIVESPGRIGSLFNKEAYLSGADKVLFDRGSAGFGAGEATYRPVATLSYMLNHALCGSNPVCFRLANVLIHAANGVLLYLLLLALFDIPVFSLLAALIFVVHPLNAEVLCCSAFRPNLLALFFSLSALICHLRCVKAGGAGAPAAAAAVVCYFLAMFSKETAIFLPAAAVLCDLMQGGARRLLERRRVYIFYTAAAVSFLVVYLFLMPPRQAVMQGAFQLGNNLLRMFDITAFYLKELFVPVDPLFIFPFQLKHSLPRAVCGAFIYGVLLCAVFRFRRLPRPFLFGLLWFFLWLFPMNNFLYAFRVPVAYRYLYLPLAGFAAAAAYPLWLLWSGRTALGNKLRYVLPGAFIAYLLVLGVFSNSNWKNETNLYLSLERKYPGSPFSRLGMGTILTRYGRFEEAKIKLEDLLRSSWNLHKNDLSVVYRTLGIIYLRLGEYGKAEEMYLKTLELFPDAAAVWGELGGCYALEEKYAAALKALNKAQGLSPGRGTFYFKKGVVYLLCKDVEKAEKEFALLRSSSEGPEDLAETEYYLLLEKAGKSVYNSLPGAESKLLGFIWKGEEL